MEQNIESSLAHDNFSLNHDVESGECESTLESSRNDNCLNCTGNIESISHEMNEVLLDFATSESTEGTENQQDPEFVCFHDRSAPKQILEGNFGIRNELVCLQTNITSTNLQPADTFYQSDEQEDSKTNNEISKPSKSSRLTESNEERKHSCPIYQSEYRLYLEKECKTTDAKKRKNALVHFESNILAQINKLLLG